MRSEQVHFKEVVGSRVRLIPLETSHDEPLFEVSRNDGIWEQLPVKIQTIEQMRQFIETALKNKETGDEFPYAVYDIPSGRLVGMTRYLRISPTHRNLNIGWTWYCNEVWGSSVNLECKYLLLKQAFEDWHACRVELITTVNHHRSQRAIEKLGAKREGILRKKYNGMDYVIYSILDEEWKGIQEILEGKLKSYLNMEETEN